MHVADRLAISLGAALAFLGCALTSSGAEIIIDNGGAGYGRTGTSWTIGASDAAAYNGTYDSRKCATSATATATWQPTFPAAGTYRVYVWYPASSNRPTNAPYKVYYNGGSSPDIPVDQQQNGGKWNYLGTFSFPTGSSANGKVTVTNKFTQTSKYVAADAVRWASPVDYTMAVSPAGAGTTSPTAGTPTTVGEKDEVTITATPAAGYQFNHWEVSAGDAVANPTSATTTATIDVAKTITAVFFRLPPELTMAVSPPGAGTTSPAVGAPYTKGFDEVVSISATAAAGYGFDHWAVSAGSDVADPNLPNTTITMDLSKTVTAVFRQTGEPQFRAVWVDAFHDGFKSKAEIDTLISNCLAGRYNAIVAEVCAYHDNAGSGHGAYWNSNIVPKAADINASGLPNGDPLLYLVQQAHANGIEVHAWMVAFRMCSTWPPANNSYLSSHPEMLSVPLAGMGTTAKTGSDYVLDAGSSDGQEYLMTVVRELVANYEIDGINWDYIRYTQADGGYPSSTTYANSGLKRFQRITGRSDTPPVSGDGQWNDFRRQTIDEVVRRTRMEMASISSNPRQPLRFSCDLVTWSDAPANFSSSSAYGLFSNWEMWLRMGYLDAGMPMCYDREYNGQYASYRNWVNACVVWRGQRHMFIGQANYLNAMVDSITQLNYALQAGADGIINYSYYATACPLRNDVWVNDWSWYPYVAANLFDAPAPLPIMPWRYPGTATEGSLWGQVLKNGVPLDNASVQVGSLPAVQTDGNGIYVVTLIDATAAGTPYDVTVTKGTDTATHVGVRVVAGDELREDFSLGTAVGPTLTQQPLPEAACPGSSVAFQVTATGTGSLSYQWQKNGANLANGGHYAGVTTRTLTVSSISSADAASYRCVVTDSTGSTTSNAAALNVKTATSISAHPAGTVVCAGTTVTFSVTVSGDSVAYQWQKDGVNLTNGGRISGADGPRLTIASSVNADAGNYRCLVSGTCGSATSNTALLTVNGGVTIIDQPAPQSVCTGATVTFTVGTTGTVSRYIWQKDGVNVGNSGHYSGASTATLTVADVDATCVGAYRCSLINSCTNVITNEAALAVTTGPAITQDPAPQSVCPGGTVSFSVAASGTPTSYLWQKDGTDLQDGGAYAGSTTATLTITGADTSMLGNYHCIVTSSCGPTTSGDAALSLLTPAQMRSEPADQTVPQGGTATFTVAASGSDLAYQWHSASGPLTDGGRISGATTATLQITNVDASDAAAGPYHAVVTGPCGTTNSANAALTVCIPAAISVGPGPQNVYAGGSAVFTVTAIGAVTYQWRINGVDLTDGTLPSGAVVSGTTTASLTLSNCAVADSSAMFDVVVSNGCGAPEVSSTAVLTVQAPVTLSNWRSLKTHSGVGEIALVLNAAATATGETAGGIKVESRFSTAQNGLTMIQIDVSAPVTVVDANLVTLAGLETSGCDASGNGCTSVAKAVTPTITMAAPQTLQIAFASGTAASESCYTITIQDGALSVPISGDRDCKVRVVYGDASGDGLVNIGDLSYIKFRLGQAITSANASCDVNLAAGINLGDLSSAKFRIGRRAICP